MIRGILDKRFSNANTALDLALRLHRQNEAERPDSGIGKACPDATGPIDRTHKPGHAAVAHLDNATADAGATVQARCRRPN